MPVRLRDPNEPDFPHGTPMGYRAGCKPRTHPCPATPACWDAYRQHNRAREEARQGQPSLYWSAPLRRHLKQFLDADWPTTALAQTAGVQFSTIRRVMKKKYPVVAASTARRLAALDRDALMNGPSEKLPQHEVAWMVGSLMAAGHLLDDLAARLGRDVHLLRHLVARRSKLVSRAAYEDIRTLHEQLAKTPGTSAYSARRARALGWQTPDAYAPDGTLWEADVRDEKREQRWARRDEEALLHMRVARMAVRDNLGLRTMAVALGMDDPTGEQVVRRARAALGLRWHGGKAHGPEEGQEERIAEILAVVEEWRRAGPLADPYPFCRKLGMMGAPKWAALDGRPKLEAAA